MNKEDLWDFIQFLDEQDNPIGYRVEHSNFQNKNAQYERLSNHNIYKLIDQYLKSENE